jgi:hypothetical protein
MALGLKVNFYKSCLMGTNVDPDFMEMACNFLNCSQGSFPFRYLGLPVGGNSGRVSTWDPLLEHLSNKLNSWGNKYISLGGRIVLLNSILNAIPIFHLSFFKMPIKVWKKIVRIQREFLWGGVEGGRKINWVKWSLVCQPKEHGGLGVKDVRLMNLSLLAKRRWRLVNGENALWKEVLVERYGRGVSTKLEGGEHLYPSSASKWWKDVVNMDKRGEEGWFNEELDRQVGDGASTCFWRVAWRGAIPFMVKYNRLFTISNQQDATVAEMWEGYVNEGSWRFTWRRRMFVWEEDLFANLLADLEGFVFTIFEDKWT